MYIYIPVMHLLYIYWLSAQICQERKEPEVKMKEKRNKKEKSKIYYYKQFFKMHFPLFLFFVVEILQNFYNFFVFSFFFCFASLTTRESRLSFKVRIITIATVWASDAQLLEEGQRVAVLLHLLGSNGSRFGRRSEGARVRHGGRLY